MKKEKLNFCQVSLARDIPIILENYANLIEFYSDFNIYIICPKNEISEFKKKLNYKEFFIISEEEIISFQEFESIFDNTSNSINYKKKFKKRLSWYFQQILKICFILNFVKNSNESMIILDSDTILIKKISFFEHNCSIKYGTFSEYHKAYYETNKSIYNKIPDYFISFLIQFVSLTKIECDFLIKNLNIVDVNYNKLSLIIVNLVFKNIFKTHMSYNGSLFSEYEFLGMSNYFLNQKIQKPILTLRLGLDGKLTSRQIKLAKFLNFVHITYEHSHPNVNSNGMLKRNQTNLNLYKIIIKSIIKFYLRYLRHLYKYYFNIFLKK